MGVPTLSSLDADAAPALIELGGDTPDEVLARFSVLVGGLGDMIAGLDLNPVIAGADGALVVQDA